MKSILIFCIKKGLPISPFWSAINGKRSLVTAIAMICAMMTMGISCSPMSPTKPASPAPATTTPAVAQTPSPAPAPTAPVATPSTTVPAVIETSFEATTYKYNNPALSLMYPRKWTVKEPGGSVVFKASAGDAARFDTVMLFVIDKAGDPATAVKESVQGYVGYPTKVDSQKSITLADGKTPATAIDLTIVTKVPFYAHAVSMNIGDKTVIAAAYTANESSQPLMQEITKTLSAQ